MHGLFGEQIQLDVSKLNGKFGVVGREFDADRIRQCAVLISWEPEHPSQITSGFTSRLGRIHGELHRDKLPKTVD